MSITVYDNSTYLFPDSGESTRLILFRIFQLTQKLGYQSVQAEFYIAFIGIAITIFHLLILSRKSMVTSSVITVMSGIAVFDMTSMIITVGTNQMLYNTEGTECDPPATLFSFQVFWFLIAIRDLVRRSSTWLGIFMAIIRLAGLKYAMRPIFQTLSRPLSGIYSILIVIFPSCILSIFYWMKYDFLESDKNWSPAESCPSYSSSIIHPIVAQQPSALFTENDGIVGKMFMFINSLISKIIPCFLLPLLTALLIKELQHAKVLRAKLVTPDKSRSHERTTVLVIFMALSFFVAELPIGIALCLQVVYTEIGFLFLTTFVTHVCNMLFTVNSITHCIVFVLMSSQYRTTVKTVFKSRRNSTVQSRSVILSANI